LSPRFVVRRRNRRQQRDPGGERRPERTSKTTPGGFRSIDSRKGLADALARCAAGDVLVVWKLDRLGRSTLDLVGLVEKLKGRGVGLKVLTGEGASIDTTRPEGKLIFAVFAAFAEFERELIRERTMAGMRAAKRRGRHVGRPRKLTPHKFDHARQLIADGKETRAGAAALLGVDAVTLRRALRGPDGTGGTGAAGEYRPASVRAGKRV
jgi:DNA invertase Pin-like site-specific DNA recombinase